jgi:hypothetical protein
MLSHASGRVSKSSTTEPREGRHEYQAESERAKPHEYKHVLSFAPADHCRCATELDDCIPDCSSRL